MRGPASTTWPLCLLVLACDRPPAELAPRECVPLDRSRPLGSVTLTPVLTGTPEGTVEKPTDLRVLPDGRAFVVTQRGEILVAPDLGETSTLAPWLDLSDRVESRPACCNEEGMYAVAFHPRFADNGELFVIYTRKTEVFRSDTVVSRFVVEDPASGAPDPDSEEILLRVQQPTQVHNGGQLRFGPDGYLYIPLGDGNGGGDREGNGQNLGTVLGSILRIDVDRAEGERPYAIPPDNPFLGVAGAAPEIYAYGFRNPWRIAFDPVTGALWAGDVGESTWEEIDRVVAGGNYGWKNLEGPACRHADPEVGCDPDDHIAPVYAYNHDHGKAITFGMVYRGTAMPALHGTLLFADFAQGTLWSLIPDAPGSPEVLADTGLLAVSFAEDRDREPYLLDWGGGGVYRIGPAADPGTGSPWASTLRETGCFTSVEGHDLAGEVIEYEVNMPLWSDGADKQRGFVLPPGESATLPPGGPYDAWSFPVGTVAIKTFSLDDKPVETRFLVRYDETRWVGATYRWNDEATAATLLDTRDHRADPAWTYPSRSGCLACHTHAAGQLLGLRTAQLHRAGGVDQIRWLARAGLASNAPANTSALPRFPSLSDRQSPLADRARAYLDANCAHCHRPGGPTPTALDLRITTALADTGACDAPPGRGDLELDDARIIAPGAPERSVLLHRMRATEPSVRMPPLARHLVDRTATAVVQRWIESLPDCE